MVDGTAAIDVVGVDVTGAAVEGVDATVDEGAAAGPGAEPEQAPSMTSTGIARHDIRGFLTSS